MPKTSGNLAILAEGGAAGGALSAREAHLVSPDGSTLDPASLANLIRQAAADGDSFTQARLLANWGFLVGAAATARAGAESRLRAALDAACCGGARVSRVDYHRLTHIAHDEGLIDDDACSRFYSLYEQLGQLSRVGTSTLRT